MPKKILNNAVATANADGASLLGYITWYSVGSDLISRDDLEKKLKDCGLSDGWLPNPIRPIDAYRRATTPKRMYYREKVADNLYRIIQLTQVYNDPERNVKVFHESFVDSEGEKLRNGREELGRITLNKKNSVFDYQAYCPVVKKLCEQAKRDYDLFLYFHSAEHIRTMIMNMIKSMSPLPLKQNGGNYFIPAKYEERLRKVYNFVNSLPTGDSMMIEMVNKLEHRENVTKKLKEHLTRTLQNCQVILEEESRVVQKSHIKEIIDEAKRVVGDFRNLQEVVLGDIDELDSLVELIKVNISKVIQEKDIKD